jgi:hypothetical protein
MEHRSTGLFKDPQLLDQYCGEIADRLQARRKERLDLYEQGQQRLQSLEKMAHLLRDPELEAELHQRLQLTEQQLRQLEELAVLPGLGGLSDAPPRPEPLPIAVPGFYNGGMPTIASIPEAAALVNEDAPPVPFDCAPAMVAEILGVPPTAPVIAAETPVPPPAYPAAPPAVDAFPLWAPKEPAAAHQAAEWLYGGGSAEPTVQPAAGAEAWDLSFLAPGVPGAPEAPAAPKLTLRATVGAQTFTFEVDETALLGRRDVDRRFSPDVDLWPDDAVSRRHAEITRREDGYYLRDLDSTNGTELNGSRIAPGVPVKLGNGDVIQLGEAATVEAAITSGTFGSPTRG